MIQKFLSKKDSLLCSGFHSGDCYSLTEIVNQNKLAMREHFRIFKSILLPALNQGNVDNILEQLDPRAIYLSEQLTRVKSFVSPEEGECVDQLVFLIGRIRYAVVSKYQEPEIMNLCQMFEDKLHSFSTFASLVKR